MTFSAGVTLGWPRVTRLRLDYINVTNVTLVQIIEISGPDTEILPKTSFASFINFISSPFFRVGELGIITSVESSFCSLQNTKKGYDHWYHSPSAPQRATFKCTLCDNLWQ